MKNRFLAVLSLSVVLWSGASGPRPSHAGWFSKDKPDTPALGSEPPVISPSRNTQDPSGLRVLSVAPSGHVQDAGETLAVTVTFDRPVAALSALSDQDAEGLLSIEPAMEGKVRWLGTDTLVFTPAKPFTRATRHTVTLHAGLKAKDGTGLGQDYRWTFDTVRPQFSQSDPYHGTQFVDLKAPVFMGFNQPMSHRRVKDFIVLEGRPTEDLFGQIRPYVQGDYSETFDVSVRQATEEEFKKHRWFAQDKTYCLVVEPQRPLKREYTYTLTLKGGPVGRGGEPRTARKPPPPVQELQPFPRHEPAEDGAS